MTTERSASSRRDVSNFGPDRRGGSPVIAGLDVDRGPEPAGADDREGEAASRRQMATARHARHSNRLRGVV
jgi:hypothetical protein